MAQCVNINHPNFKVLEKELGFNMAHSLTVENGYKYPTLDEAVTMIRGTKMKQFKSAIVHMRNLKAPTVEDLLKGFNGIVRKYGDTYYVVNGSRISEAPAPISATEVEQANIRFLEAVNDTFGGIFKLSGTPGAVKGIKLITGNENIKEGITLPTTFDESNLLGDVADDVKQFRNSNKTMGSAYLRNAQWFAEGFIPGPASMKNNVKLPYANKSIAKKLATLRTKFESLGSSKVDKAAKEKIKNDMFSLADQAFTEFKEALKKNLGSLFEAWDKNLIARSRHWYDGANRIAQNFSTTYGLPLEATAGILAVLSPQNEWFNNISGADRVMNVLKNHMTTPVSSAMYDNAINLSKGEPFEGVVRALKEQLTDKSIGDILGLADNNTVYNDIAANVLRVIDMTVHGPEVQVVTPEGEASGIKTDVGGLTRFAWGSTAEIFKAISIFQNPTIENISEKIGKGNKVRNFYNNIVSPNSDKGQVTVDTHAMGAAFLNVISAEEASAMNLFRSGGSPIYAVIKQAYQEIGAEKGLRPREVQSITWEAIRLLIKEADKTDANRDEINKIWEQVQNKKLTHEQAITNIIGRFSFGNPQWNRPTNTGANKSGVRTTEAAIQQRELDSGDIRGQQLPTGETTPGVVEDDVKLDVNKTGKTQEFFSDVVSGKSEKFKPKKEWSPILSFNILQAKFKKIYDKFKGNFDNHIAASIPTFRETQIKVGAALQNMYANGGLIYDIGGSEGGFVKAITLGSEGKIKSINLDVNEEMQKAHNANPVEGSDYVKEAFYESYTDEETGVTYPKHVPAEKADVVHESMVFQFISPERKQFIKEIKSKYIKPDGIVLLEEKIVPESEEEWLANEKKKDAYKLQSFPQEAITEKAEQVLAGMKTNQTSEQDLIDNLKSNFKHVAAYWDAGNFKGYIASDSQQKVNEFLASIGGTITSKYSSSQSKLTADSSLFTEPNEEVKAIADEYKSEKGLNISPGVKIYTIDVQFGKKIADAYMAMKDEPNNPEVKASYEAFANETIDQYNFLISKGYTFELFDGAGEPYADAPSAMADIRDNKHFYILSTNKYYGPNAITDQQRKENPFLQESGLTDLKGNALLVNDVFRGVHDLFGHAERGNGFGPIGEENAWDVHARMYTPLARRAMTVETRGHTSMIEFGPQARNEAGEVTRVIDENDTPLADPQYPVAKIGLLPLEFSLLSEEIGEERIGVKPHPQAVKVEFDEQVLAKVTANNSEQEKPEDIGWKPVDTDVEFQKLHEEQFTAEQKKRFSLDNVIRMLKNKFGVKVVVVNEPGSFWRGKYANGVITINEAYVSPDTPFHEVIHPFIDVIKKDNPELYNALMEEVKNSESGKESFEYVKTAYPELSESDQWDEVLVMELGRMSARQDLENNEGKTLFGKFIDWLKTTLAKMGIMTQNFRSNMSMQEFADLIVNPSFVFDLNKKVSSENHAERFSKLSNTFDEVINNVRQKLQVDAVLRTKNMSEDVLRRKFFFGKIAELLAADPRDLKAIDNFIISSAVNLKKLNEKFQEFKDAFDAKRTKSKDDLAKLSQLLNEIEDCITLYEDVDLLITSVLDEFPDAEDSIGNLKKNYRREAALINDYKAYAKELIVNWLFPHANSAINQALATDKPFNIVSKATYEAVQKEMQANNLTPSKRQILEEAFKRELATYITTAKKDASAVTQFLGPLLHSRDPLSSLIARSVVEEYTGALKKGLTIQDKLTKLVRRTRGLPVFNTNKDHFDFYAKYMRQADSYEYKGVNQKGEPEYHYVKRWAFHEEYKWDEFYKAKRTMEEKIGVAPSKNDVVKYAAWKKARDAWYSVHTVKTGNGYIPATTYKNPDFVALQSDPLFKELYGSYKQANELAGKAGLKYGIIPQRSIITAKVEKGKVAQDILEKIRLFVGEDDQVYFSQKNNLKERRTVPLPFTRMVEDNDLSFDLLNSVVKYAVSAQKYNSISQIEPHVNILKNFIGGNASLSIDSRQVVKLTSNGLKALSKAERKAMQVDAARINEQLDSFLNDVVYGQPMKKAAIQMFNSKFKVEDKNGKIEIIKGFSDMSEHIGIPDLDYHGFKVGEERKLKDYKVTMLRKDWNWSVKKSANTLGLITAFQQLALNPVAGVTNIIRAKLETFVEGAAGRYFNIGNALKAEGIYFTALGKGDFFEDLKGGKPSFISEMLIDYDAIQGELYDELGKKISGSLANKLFRRNHFFFMQQGGEHYVQTQMLIAMMLHKKVKLNSGEEISLYEAKEREYKGQLKMSDTKWTTQDDEDFRQTVKFVNTQMHGNYNKLDKALLQRQWWGSLLLMFRKHIYTGFASRYRKGYVNYQTGNYTEGYYRTFINGLVTQVRSIIEQKRMAQLTEDEKYAFRKIAADFAAMALLMFSFKAFDDDDDEEEFNDYMALISRRLISEGVQYTPIVGTMDLAKVVTNPAASVSTVDKVWDAVSQSISDPMAEYERSGPGYQVGQNKAAVKWGRALPLYRQYINTVEPERLLQFYGRNSIWFLKPSAGKGEDTNE